MKFEIKNRWNGSVVFTAEIEAGEDTPFRIKLGLAVKAAVATRADLTGAVLTRAVLTGADLTDADLTDADLTGAVLTRAVLTGAVLTRAVLTGADLTDAVLTGAVLTGADLTDAVLTRAVLTGADLTDAVLTDAVLRSFKADLWMILTQNRAEVPGLIIALREGRINGSTYQGTCACLVGTIANIRGVDLYHSGIERDSSRPAERWFLMIREGDKPGDATGGGFAAGKAVEWAEEWCLLNGIPLSPAVEVVPTEAGE